MMKWMHGMLIAGVAAAAGGCVDLTEAPPAQASIRVTPDRMAETPDGIEAYVIESNAPNDRTRTPLSDEQWWPHALGVTDPCDCTSEACLANWVDHNLGCNVCVVLYCDGNPTAHACSECGPPGVNGPGPH